MTRYEMLAACFRSGQMSVSEFIALLRADEAFAQWYTTKYPII